MGKQMANKMVDPPKLTHFTANAGSVATNANPAAATAGDELGYIGKSGRFVAITEAAT